MPRDLLDQVGLARDVAAAPVRARVDVEPVVARRVDAEAERVEDLRAALARDRRAEQPARRARRAAGSTAGVGPAPPTSIVPGTSARPHSSTISCVATRLRLDAPARAAAPSRSARDASLRSASRVEVRLMFGPFQVATSISTRVVRVARPRSARRPSRRRSTSGRRRRRSRRCRDRASRSSPSSVVTFSPSRAAAHDEPAAGDAVEVERVQRLAGQQHHVVGDVDDVGDRPLAGRHQPRLQPRRRRARSSRPRRRAR